MSTKSSEPPKVGDIYETSDRYTPGRQIRLLSAFEKSDPWNHLYPAFRVETFAAPAAPWTVGNKSSIGVHMLIKRYRKVTETAAANTETRVN